MNLLTSFVSSRKTDIISSSANVLRQTVQISTDGSGHFECSAQAIALIIQFVKKVMGQCVHVPFSMRSGTSSQLCFYSGLVMPSDVANTQNLLEFPAMYDLDNNIEHLLSRSKFIYTMDNCVTLMSLQALYAQNSRIYPFITQYLRNDTIIILTHSIIPWLFAV